MEEVPADVAENWTDQLTIKLFNEELSDVFPYIYKLVSEATKAQELGPEDLVDESGQEELGRLKDKYSKAAKTKEEVELEDTMEGLMGQFSEANEAERDTHCSDKCCGSDTKAEDCDCPPDCEGCNCNAEMDECPPQQDAAPQQQMAAEKPKTPLGEFILSYYDRETGSFPKGETAILTMVEKDYGDEYVRPAHAFIEKVHSTFVQHERMNNEQNDIFALAGI